MTDPEIDAYLDKLDQESGEDGPLSAAAKSGSTRRALVALRDILAHEIEGNRCKTCRMTQMRTGELSALALRFQKVIEDLEALPDDEQPDKPVPEGVTSLASIRNRRPSNGVATSPDPARPNLGTKSAPRRQGGRKRSG
jgi:hypothetical protein